MKRILGIAVVLCLMGVLTLRIGCSKAKEEPPTGKVETKKIEKERETAAQEIDLKFYNDLGKDVKLEMVLVPAGKFKMGSPASEKGRVSDETQHEVTLTKPFYMGKYEVTQEQWEAVMGDNPSEIKGVKLPVTNVSWEDCQEFIKKLNARTNGGYKLPTEAEWEYACRAGTTTKYSFGDSLTNSDANISNMLENNKSIKAVGSYKPNAFGLYDVHGNVREWCEDWRGEYPFAVIDPTRPATTSQLRPLPPLPPRLFAVTDPKGPRAGTDRVLRGGSFVSFVYEARSAYRGDDFSPSTRSGYVGFRLARTADTVPTRWIWSDPTAVIPATGNLLVAPFTEAKAKEVQKEVAKSLKKEVEEEVDLGKGIKLDLVLVPAGKFKMGSPASEKNRDEDEKQHEVTLTKPFYMGKYEVTQEQWESVMSNNPSTRTKGAKLPVTDVSWNDCQEFIKKLNAKTDGGYRLPTESEWEYACRAGTTTAYSFGDKITPKDANYDDSIGKPVIVGSYRPNAFGLYDMHGNVWEWCEDWYGDYPAGAVTDPKGPAKGMLVGLARVLRGGSFLIVGDSRARSSVRTIISFILGNHQADDRSGFRLARTADIKAVASPTVTKPDSTAVLPATGNLLVVPFTEAKAKEVQKEVAKSLKKEVEEKEDLGEGVKLEMVLIPAGKFKMGSPESEKGRNVRETQHEVTITKPFYIGKYEVTQEQWEGIMGKNPSDTKGATLPVTDISWNDCQEFIKKLNAKTDGGYRLPTEAEWEYACRAGTTTAYSFGDKITPKDANYDDSKIRKPVEVGSYNPNAFGLFDMHGNVEEWCEDWYGAYPEGLVTDPKGPATGGNRVSRGGSFSGVYVPEASSSVRYLLFSLQSRSDRIGFRLVRTP